MLPQFCELRHERGEREKMRDNSVLLLSQNNNRFGRQFCTQMSTSNNMHNLFNNTYFFQYCIKDMTPII